MSKSLKITFLIIVLLLSVVIIGIGITYIVSGDISDVEEYKVGNDTIKSIKSVIDRREITSMTSDNKNNITTRIMEYKSVNVKEDLTKYIEYLTNEAGFILTKDVNLENLPSKIELSKDSEDEGKIIMVELESEDFGYKIMIQKGEKTAEL